jgi:hypothetical protein
MTDEISKSPWRKWKENLGETRPWDLLDKDNITDDEIGASRYEICKACPELINLTKQCKQCGCFMVAKTKLKAATCPIGKW